MGSSARRPSPAAIIAMVALGLALAGTAIAQDPVAKLTKSKVKSIARKQIARAAPGLSVASAQTADDAANLGGSPPGAFAASDAEPYHEVGAPGEPPFFSGWANNDPDFATTAGFYKDPWGVVHLKGTVARAGSTHFIFTLPAGYRPTKDTCMATVKSPPLPPAATYVCVFPDGGVAEIGFLTDGKYLLDGLTFRAG